MAQVGRQQRHLSVRAKQDGRLEAGRQQFLELGRCSEGTLGRHEAINSVLRPLSVVRSNAGEGFRQTGRNGGHKKALQVWLPEGLNRWAEWSQPSGGHCSCRCGQAERPLSQSSYFRPSGIMAAVSDLVTLSCSAVTVAPCRLAPVRSA